jgi:hypothetical protein
VENCVLNTASVGKKLSDYVRHDCHCCFQFV